MYVVMEIHYQYKPVKAYWCLYTVHMYYATCSLLREPVVIELYVDIGRNWTWLHETFVDQSVTERYNS